MSSCVEESYAVGEEVEIGGEEEEVAVDEPYICKTVESNRGGTKIWVKGHLMVKNKVNKKNEALWYWECDQRRKWKCKVRMTTRHLNTDEHELVAVRGEHADPPRPERYDLAVQRALLKKRARSCEEKPQQILDNAIESAEDASVACELIRSAEANKQLIKRARKHVKEPPLPPQAPRAPELKGECRIEANALTGTCTIRADVQSGACTVWTYELTGKCTIQANLQPCPVLTEPVVPMPTTAAL